MVNDVLDEISLPASISLEAAHRAVTALARNLTWANIASETIDNSLAHKASNITVTWDDTGDIPVFRVVDDGLGSDNPEAFLTPGVTAGNPDSMLGNSTFGMGLFAIECQLHGELRVATHPAGSQSIWLISREEKHLTDGRIRRIESTPQVAANYQIPKQGTSVAIYGPKKRAPASTYFRRMAQELALAYSPALPNKTIILVRRDESIRLLPVPTPEVEELKTAEFEVEGNTYSAEWGVTKRPVPRVGCGLVCGAKLFDHTSAPFSGLSGSMFHCRMWIPPSARVEAMDLCKRYASEDFLIPVFDKLWELIEEELLRAHALAVATEDVELNSRLSSMLSGEPVSTARARKVNGGNEDLREFNGRDPNGRGATPANSGRKRTGRKRLDKSSVARNARIEWVMGGELEPAVSWKPDGGVIAFNEDVPALKSLKESKNHTGLLLLAIPVIAHAEEKRAGASLFPEMGDAAEITRELLRRLHNSQTT